MDWLNDIAQAEVYVAVIDYLNSHNYSQEAVAFAIEIINSGIGNTLISVFPFFQYPIGSDYSSLYPNLTGLLNEYMELLKTRENLINTIHDLTGVSTEDIINDLTWGEGPIVEIQDLGYDNQGNEIKGKFNPMQNPNVIYLDIDLVNYLENLSNIETPTPEEQQQLAILNGLIVYAVALHEYVHYADFAFDGTT